MEITYRYISNHKLEYGEKDLISEKNLFQKVKLSYIFCVCVCVCLCVCVCVFSGFSDEVTEGCKLFFFFYD